MSKEVEQHICRFCETEYKLTYLPEKASGFAKFCPFCSEENIEDDIEDEYDESDTN